MDGGTERVAVDIAESLQEEEGGGVDKALEGNKGDGASGASDGVLVAKEVSGGKVVVENVAEEEEEEKKGDDVGGSVSIFRLFSYADGLDYLLMFIGFVGAAVHGCALPVFFLFFGKLLNGFGDNVNNPHKAADTVSKVREQRRVIICGVGVRDHSLSLTASCLRVVCALPGLLGTRGVLRLVGGGGRLDANRGEASRPHPSPLLASNAEARHQLLRHRRAHRRNCDQHLLGHSLNSRRH